LGCGGVTGTPPLAESDGAHFLQGLPNVAAIYRLEFRLVPQQPFLDGGNSRREVRQLSCGGGCSGPAPSSVRVGCNLTGNERRGDDALAAFLLAVVVKAPFRYGLAPL
jgi:hypothetical protein